MKCLISRRSLLFTFASILSFNILVSAAEPAPPAKAPVKQDREKMRAERKAREAEVFRADKELNAALVRGDVAALERLVASGYSDTYEEQVLVWDGRQGTPSTKKVPGKKRTREELLSGLKSGALKFSSLQVTNEETSSMGNVAALGGENVMFLARLIEKSAFNGKDTSGEFLVTRIYLKADGKWICKNSTYDPLVAKQ